MCGAPAQNLSLEGIDVAKETVISGSVRSGDQPVSGAYVRLLDANGEFTAEVVASAEGEFRFFARPGSWTLRALSPKGNADAAVEAVAGTATSAVITV